MDVEDDRNNLRPLTGAGSLVSDEKESLCCGILERDDNDPDFGCLLGPALLSVLIVVCGTVSTISSKLMYAVRSHGIDSCQRHDDDDTDDNEKWHNCKFTKPWFQTLVMKLAMSLCFFIAKFTQWYRGRREKIAPVVVSGHDALSEALLPGVENIQSSRRFATPSNKVIRLIAYPAFTDLLQTVLAQAGLLWVTSSTYQMMRGSVIIFTCFFSIRFMDKRMTRIHWTAILIVCVAIIIVGVAGLFVEKNQNANFGTYILGLALIVLGQLVGAVQFVLEEYLMVSMHVTPTLLVGWEGALLV